MTSEEHFTRQKWNLGGKDEASSLYPAMRRDREEKENGEKMVIFSEDEQLILGGYRLNNKIIKRPLGRASERPIVILDKTDNLLSNRDFHV